MQKVIGHRFWHIAKTTRVNWVIFDQIRGIGKEIVKFLKHFQKVERY